MSYQLVLAISRDLILTTLMLAMPAVLISLVVGLLISVFQTLTSIQEQTLSFAPRIVAVAVGMLLTLPWTLRVMSGFAYRMFVLITEVQ